MIPKIIHYTWFSGEPFPEKVQQCIDSWHRYMPEYEYIFWDAERIKEIDSVWLTECLEKKKWAYAADMVRMYAVYKYGGIYLDTDCMVYKSFDDFLGEPCFIGKEMYIHTGEGPMHQNLTSHCFGAEKGNEYIARCCKFYDSRHFVLSTDESLPMMLKWNAILAPFVQCELAKQIGYNPFPSNQNIQYLKGLTIFPQWYFDARYLDIKKKRCYCQHLTLGSWREERLPAVKMTIGYKMFWWVEILLRRLFDMLGYILIKKI